MLAGARQDRMTKRYVIKHLRHTAAGQIKYLPIVQAFLRNCRRTFACRNPLSACLVSAFKRNQQIQRRFQR